MANDPMATSDAAEQARKYNPMDPAFAADPYPLFHRLRDECPVAWSDELGGFHFITRYADVNQVLRDPRRFSSRWPGVPRPDESLLAVPPLDQDPPKHTQYRQMLLPFFTGGQAASWEPLARETARQLASELTSGDDAYMKYCFPIPTAVIARILGVDPSMREQFLEWIELTVDQTAVPEEGLMEARVDVFQYFGSLLEERKSAPQDDLLTFLLDVEVGGEPMGDMERLGMAQVLLIAGIDTTANTLGNSIWYLAQNPEARRRLASDPSLIPTAVEEFLRIYAPVSIARTPMEDVELSGCPIATKDQLFLIIPSANRDDRQFENPNEVVLDREHNEHIAFGAGVHRCIGANIARMELRVGLEEFLAALPEFELADPDAVEWKSGPIRGPKRIPLRF